MKALTKKDTIKTLTTHYIDGVFVESPSLNRVIPSRVIKWRLQPQPRRIHHRAKFRYLFDHKFKFNTIYCYCDKSSADFQRIFSTAFEGLSGTHVGLLIALIALRSRCREGPAFIMSQRILSSSKAILPDLMRRDGNTQNSISFAQERDAVITS
jgi:hypothetical protein